MGLRSPALATVLLAVSGLFLLLALAAAFLSQAERSAHPILAVIRSIVFLTLLGLTGWLQMHAIRPAVDSGHPGSSAKAKETKRP